MSRKAPRTSTDERYRLSLTNIVAQNMGVGVGADGTPNSVTSPGLEIVIINRIYPSLMQANVTYRDSVTDTSSGQKEDVLILSPMVGDEAKMLWLPDGINGYDPVKKATYREPTQKNLTGIVVNIKGQAQNGQVLIGYIRMQGEGAIVDTSNAVIQNDTPIMNLLNQEVFDYHVGQTEVTFDENSVDITTPNFTLNGLNLLDTNNLANLVAQIGTKAPQSALDTTNGNLATDIGNLSTLVGRYNGISLGNAVDLNTITTTGLYYQDLNVQAASGTNYPVPLAGTLEVFPGSGTMQRYTSYNYNIVYIRHLYQGNWGGWVQQNELNWGTGTGSTYNAWAGLSGTEFVLKVSGYIVPNGAPYLALTFNSDGTLGHYNTMRTTDIGTTHTVFSTVGDGGLVPWAGLAGHYYIMQLEIKVWYLPGGPTSITASGSYRDYSTTSPNYQGFINFSGTWQVADLISSIQCYYGNSTAAGWTRMLLTSPANRVYY